MLPFSFFFHCSLPCEKLLYKVSNLIVSVHVVSGSAPSYHASTPGASTSKQSWTEEELTPIDLDDEELEAYAEECAQKAALADFDDIPEEELFSWSDFEEPDELTSHSGHQKTSLLDEYDMDIA